MAEQIPEGDQLGGSSSLDIGNPPEPDNASIRAERGSPTPSSVTVDNLPSLPDSFSHSVVPDPFGDVQEHQHALPPGLPSTSTSDLPHPIDPHAQNTVNSDYLAQLLDLGFDSFTSRLALIRTGNIDVEQAVTWIIERSNLSDFEDSSESEDNEEMGAVNSTGELQNVQPLRTGVERMAFPQALVHRGRTHKMVLVVNTSLKMGTGKMAAQVGHATLGVYRQAMGSEMGQEAVSAWIRHGQVKIVVKGQSTEQLMDMYKTAKDTGCFCYLVQDAGYTQIPPGSRTILGVFGTVEQVDAVTGGLKLL